MTPQSFADWKQRFDAEVRLKKAELEPEAVSRDKGPSGKIFFQNQDIANATRVNIFMLRDSCEYDCHVLTLHDLVCFLII